MKDKYKAIIWVVLLLSMLCAGFSVYIILRGQENLNDKLAVQEDSIKALINSFNKNVIQQYENRIVSFVNIEKMPQRKKLIQAFARQDRTEVFRLALPLYNLLQLESEYFSGFNWFLPDNHVFLRLLRPDMFGDDLNMARPDVVAANRQQQQKSGYLIGKCGLAFRVVQPVNYLGDHLGSIEFVIKDSYLVEMITTELAIPAFQVVPAAKFKNVKFPRLSSHTTDSFIVQSNDPALLELVEHNIDWSLARQNVVLNGREYIVTKVIDLLNYAENVEGSIFVLLDISAHQAEIKRDVIKFFVLNVFIILLVSFLVARVYERVLKKITDLNEELEDRVKIRTSALKNEQEKLFVTLRSIGDAVITTDLGGSIVLINKVAEQLTGWSQQEAVGRMFGQVFKIIDEKTESPCQNLVDEVLISGAAVTLAVNPLLIARDGSRYPIEESCTPIFDKESKIIGAILVFRDVTEKTKTAVELLKIKKLESVGVLAGGIAHDFNNILAVILGNIELALLSVDKSSDAYLLLREADRASLRAQDLAQQLLTFAKGGEPSKKTAVIGEIITESAHFVLRGSGVICKLHIPDNLWLVDVDGGQLSQVIQNLVINGRHAMADRGELIISCVNVKEIEAEINVGLSGKYVKIIVQDNGGGITEKYLEKIFDPYFTTKKDGSGLGLAICHSIIKKHQGHIEVRSKIGEGTTFTIYLPVAVRQSSNEPIKIAQQSTVVKGAKILVMDDEEQILSVIRQVLEHFGHEVLLARDGRQAVKIFSEHQMCSNPVDLTIMDLTIPGGMGGRKAVQEILAIDPAAKVIVASGYSSDPIMADYRRYGFVAALAKPFILAELNKTVTDVIMD